MHSANFFQSKLQVYSNNNSNNNFYFVKSITLLSESLYTFYIYTYILNVFGNFNERTCYKVINSQSKQKFDIFLGIDCINYSFKFH